MTEQIAPPYPADTSAKGWRFGHASSFRMPRVAPEKPSHRRPGTAFLAVVKGDDMATNTKYSELLRDPRWQKVRLKKLEAAGWECELCADTDTMLSVHHKRYVKGRQPWEYDMGELVVLCQPCHEQEHESKDCRSELLARLAVDGPLGIDDFFAYGAGAVSAFSWLMDEPLKRLLSQIRSAKQFQFDSGRAAAALSELLIGKLEARRATGMEPVADLFSDDDFRDDLLALLKKHGVKFRPAADGSSER